MVPDSSSLISYLLMIMLASYAVLLDLTPLAVGKWTGLKETAILQLRIFLLECRIIK